MATFKLLISAYSHKKTNTITKNRICSMILFLWINAYFTYEYHTNNIRLHESRFLVFQKFLGVLMLFVVLYLLVYIDHH